jgi:hypothetical protein
VNWIEKVWTLLKRAEAPQHPEEVADDVPRHRWVPVWRAAEGIGKEVEIHEDNNVFGHTTVRGRLTQVSYDSADDLTTLSIQGSNFSAIVDMYGDDNKFIIHL